MSDIVLDIGSEKIYLAEITEGSLSKPIYLSRPPEEEGILWILSALSAWPKEIDTVVAAASGLVSGGRLYSERLGNIDFLDLIKSQFNADALLINDGHAAALATEKDVPTLAVHLGSGMALGYIGEDGELFRGASGFACEASRSLGGLYLEKFYRERVGKSLDNEKIFHSAKEGYPQPKAVIQDLAKEVALELRRIIYTLDPQKIVFSGGGFFESFKPWLLPALEEELSGKGKLWREVLKDRQIEESPLGAFAPLIGAASLIIPTSNILESSPSWLSAKSAS